MAKKDNKHCVIRNEKLFCSNCGKYQVIPYPIQIPMFTAMTEAFNKIHANCKPTWKQLEVDQSLTVDKKMQWWIENGERGISSETMFHYIAFSYGRPEYLLRRGKVESHPHDPDDFRRCYELLKTIPEWKSRLDTMKEVSPAWKNLVDHWDELIVMLEEQMVAKKDNGMYDLMEKLIRGK